MPKSKNGLIGTLLVVGLVGGVLVGAYVISTPNAQRVQDSQRRGHGRVARDDVPPRGHRGRGEMGIRAAHLHGPRDRAKLLHAHPLRPLASARRASRRRAIRHNASRGTAVRFALG